MRHKPHRSHPEIESFSAAEKAAAVRKYAVGALGAVLSRSEPFLRDVDLVRDGQLGAADIAARLPKRYAGREVIAELVDAAANEPLPYHLVRRGHVVEEARLRAWATKIALTRVGDSSSWTDQPIGPADPKRWVRSNSEIQRGARNVAAVLAGICLADDCAQRLEDPRSYWCGPHQPIRITTSVRHADLELEREQRAMRTVLRGAARSLE